jgi:hypothetical protein
MKNFISILTNLLYVAVISMAIAVTFQVNFIVPFAGINIIAYTMNDFMPAHSLGIRVFTAPGGAATPFSFNINYLPQFLTYNPGANPLTSLKVSMKGTVLHDWNAAHIAAVNGFMFNGVLPANNVLLRLATGHMPNQDVTISGVTSAAGAIDFFVNSDNEVSTARPFMSRMAQILALTPTLFQKFTAIFIPTLAAGTDRAEVLYLNGHRQILENQEIQALSGIWQQTNGIIINNVNSYIDQAWIVCAAAQPAYILSVAL